MVVEATPLQFSRTMGFVFLFFNFRICDAFLRHLSLSEGAPLDACQAAFATPRLDEMRGAVGSPTGLQPWLVSSLPSLGSRVDPRQRGVLPVHTHLHGFEPAAHAGAAEGARGVPDHGQGASGGSRRPARRRPAGAVLQSVPFRMTA